MRLRMADRSCPICGSTDEGRVFSEANADLNKLDAVAFSSRKFPDMHWRLIECPRCDLLYATPAPATEALSAAYESAAFDSGLEARYAARTYAQLIPRVQSGIGKPAGALDIGTGDGAFLEELLNAGFTGVVGVERSSAPIAAAGPLRSGGAALFVGHNRRSVSARLMGSRSPIFDIEHLQLFSPNSARYLMAAAGFDDIQVGWFWNRYPVSYWTKLLPLPTQLKRTLIKVLETIRIGRVSVPMVAGNFFVIGYKRTSDSDETSRASAGQPSV